MLDVARCGLSDSQTRFAGLRSDCHPVELVSPPGGQLSPSVVAVLAERGLDASTEFPKPVTDEVARAADVIVTMGCGDACPIYPGTRVVDWELTDPAGLGVDEVRPIVDDVDGRVRALLEELLGTHD